MFSQFGRARTAHPGNLSHLNYPIIIITITVIIIIINVIAVTIIIFIIIPAES